jgi:hypothetical protein
MTVTDLRHVGQDIEHSSLLSQKLGKCGALVGDTAYPSDIVHVHFNAFKPNLILQGNWQAVQGANRLARLGIVVIKLGGSGLHGPLGRVLWDEFVGHTKALSKKI